MKRQNRYISIKETVASILRHGYRQTLFLALPISFKLRSLQVGRLENAIGWYHSHPGYGCWLSGIDVSTQMLNQNFQDPFVAIVIDPVRTISAGKVNLGAFRTYPKGTVILLIVFVQM